MHTHAPGTVSECGFPNSSWLTVSAALIGEFGAQDMSYLAGSVICNESCLNVCPRVLQNAMEPEMQPEMPESC